MLKNKHSLKLILLVIFLVLLTAVSIVIRITLFHQEQPSQDYEDWRLTYYLRFYPKKEQAQLHILLPVQKGKYEIIRENFSYSNLKIEIRSDADSGKRELVGISRKQKNIVTLSAQFLLRFAGKSRETELTGKQVHRFFPGNQIETIFSVLNVRKLRTSFKAKKKIPPLNHTSAADKEGIWVTLIDLTRLSSRMEDVLVVLLLMPLGALITSVIHNIIGLKTFSHFAPTLLAVSFMHARFIPGLIVFFTILLVGFSFRFLVERLKLTLRPRVSLVLLAVCMTLVFMVSISDYLGVSPGTGGILLPMIALTLLIERFFRNFVKKGHIKALTKLMGTMVAAICSLVVFQVEEVHWVLLNFPEVVFLIAAALIMVGLHRAKKLTGDEESNEE